MSTQGFRARARAVAAGNTANLVATGIALAITRLVGSLILTRLLPTDAFATVAIVSSIAVSVALMSDLGILAFVVRHEEELTPSLLDEIWTIRLIYGTILAVATAAVALPISYFLAKPELAMPIAVGGLTFLFGNLDSLAFASMLRQHRVKRLNVIEIATQLATLFGTVGLAVLLQNFWALIAGGYIGQAVRAALSYLVFENQKRRWSFSIARVQELWKFSRYISSSTLLTLLITQSDKLILGRTMALGEMGLYSIALNIASLPQNVANQYAEKILFPRISDAVRRQDRDLALEFYRILPVSLLMMAASACAAGASDFIVRLLYPGKIAGTSFYLEIILVGTIFSINNSRINNLMIALGKTQFTFLTNIVRVISLLFASSFGFYFGGVFGVVWAFSVVEVAAQVYGWRQLHKIGLLRIKPEAAILVIVAASYAFGLIAGHIGGGVLDVFHDGRVWHWLATVR